MAPSLGLLHDPTAGSASSATERMSSNNRVIPFLQSGEDAQAKRGRGVQKKEHNAQTLEGKQLDGPSGDATCK